MRCLSLGWLFEDFEVQHLIISLVVLVAAIAMATTGVHLF